MDTKDKEVYVAPTVLVVEVRSEGIVCASNGEGSGENFSWDS